MNMPTESKPAIILENVSVRYRLPSERIGTLKEYAIRLLQRRLKHREFWAIKDLDLNIQQGEVFGIVGDNGAGKSTLLKVISKVLRPTTGRVRIYGKIAPPLLELGAGFHPELSGRENVFLNGALLGYSHDEMNQVLMKSLNSRNWLNLSTRQFALILRACTPGSASRLLPRINLKS